ncbi:C2H2 domain-containing protein [Lindgomyces ingoldianus]|uniref:C2H2 domain-containing protein n=1 Tax=Lindgomyces ingoldianus TaxID=673940 RepID=A0ACB6R4G4_9PLEO|nr:C2H2 domain-containing protein [Lindgomyces ingoldianus]KAF2474163.1 C2H2 domain-containing protein [Lindgomyces ingoldianus]
MATNDEISSLSRASTAVNPRSTADPFKAALTKFRSRLSGQQLTEFENSTYENLCHEVIRIQHEQEGLKNMMNLSRLQSCLEALNQFGKVIEVFLNVSRTVAFIWGPIKFLLLTASTLADSFDTLLDAYEQIGECLPLLSEYESLFRQNPYMLQALELIYMDILEFHQHALRFFTGKVWKRFFRSMWNDFGTKFNGILKSLGRHKRLIETRAHLIHFRQYQEDIEEMNTKLDLLVAEEQNKKTKAVKEWIAAGSQAKLDHEKFCEVRSSYPTTGLWILRNEYIKNWMDAEVPTTPLAWMTGMPGAGKTILASVIIEECKRRKPVLTSYFYCNCDGGGNSSAVGVFKGLLDQLLDQFPDLMPHCHTRSSSSGEPSLRSLGSAKKLLEDFCLTIPKQYIIVDGLDECEGPERKQILEFFVQLVTQCDSEDPGRLRILFVSQDYADIKKALHRSLNSKVVPKIISLTSTDNERDIRIYVSNLASQVKVKYSLEEELAHYIRELTISRAHGMFLYAELVMSNLLKQPTKLEFLDETQLERFPNGLEEAYERIVSRIKRTSSEAEWNVAKKLLGWMVCAKRQLTWKEIQVALSIDFDAQTIEYDDRRLRVHIHDICGSLVQRTGDRVHLVHSTAKLYITQCTREIHEPSVECELAALCLQYLTFPCFQDDQGIDNFTLHQAILQGHLAFQDYAVAKWFHHVNAFIHSGNDLLTKGNDVPTRLSEIAVALEDFTMRYDEEAWHDNILPQCEEKCKVFQREIFFNTLAAVASHIFKFQEKGFKARHVVSIQSLSKALERNREILEGLPPKLSASELAIFRQFYDDEKIFKCPKVTCRYFSEGFKDLESRKRHVNVHDRPFQCTASQCFATECGFSNKNDLDKHRLAFHPEMSELANRFKSLIPSTAKKTRHCHICGKMFTRSLHLRDHIRSHLGERPHACSECGKAFTRKNDCTRHEKLHDRR